MTAEMAARTLDDTILPSITGSGGDCYVGIQFSTDYIGVVNEISFFMDEFTVDKVVNHLLIEGSTDNFDTSV